MLMGHYATALIPYEKTRNSANTPFWVFLLAAQFLDFLMVALVVLNVESLSPQDRSIAKFNNIQSDMFISHDIVPAVGWALLFGALVFAFTRNRMVSLWCIGLVGFHEFLDWAVGFEHRVYDARLFGSDGPWVGLDLYGQSPLLAVILEVALCALCIGWFVRARAKRENPTSLRLKIGLIVILVGGTLASLKMAM